MIKNAFQTARIPNSRITDDGRRVVTRNLTLNRLNRDRELPIRENGEKKNGDRVALEVSQTLVLVILVPYIYDILNTVCSMND